MACSSSISSSSMCSRPAVSTSTVSKPLALASASAPRARATGSIVSGWYTATPACPDTTSNCWMAAGRRTSVDTVTGCLPCLVSHRASLPVVVVLPDPWRPRSRTTRGFGASGLRPPGVSPNSASSSSRTIFRTCCAGDRLLRTAWSMALSRTRSMNALTTWKLTSASSRARRISRSTPSTCSGVRRTSPRSVEKASWMRVLSDSNMAARTGRAERHRYCGAKAFRRKRLCYAIIRLISKDLRPMTRLRDCVPAVGALLLSAATAWAQANGNFTQPPTLGGGNTPGESTAMAGAYVPPTGPPPRLSNGKVDFSGVWDHAYVPDMARTSAANPRLQTGPRELPYTPAGLKNIEAYDPERDGDYTGMCMPFGLTRSVNAPSPMQIMQTNAHVAFLFEQNSWFHVAPFRESHAAELEPTW